MKDKSTVKFISIHFCRILERLETCLQSRFESMWLSQHALRLLDPSSPRAK
jgi:hypothetical protein